MIDFLTLKPEAFGLDISDQSLKIIKLKKKGRFFDLASFGEIFVPLNLVNLGIINDEKALAEVIKEAIARVNGEKINAKAVIVSLPEDKSFLQVIQMPKMSLKDLEKAIQFEAENYIPFPIKEVYLDFQVIEPLVNHLDHADVLITATPRAIVNSYFNTLQLAGLQPQAFELESFAISRAVVKEQMSPRPVLILDLGAARTGLIIFSGSSLRFATSLPFHSKELTEIIAATLGIDEDRAEQIKINYGLDAKTKVRLQSQAGETEFKKEVLEDEKAFQALLPNLMNLVKEGKKWLDYYYTHKDHEHLLPDGKVVEKIFLSGGGANLKGLDVFLTKELGVKVELANPLVNILADPQRGFVKPGPNKPLIYTTALGLALRGVLNTNNHD